MHDNVKDEKKEIISMKNCTIVFSVWRNKKEFI